MIVGWVWVLVTWQGAESPQIVSGMMLKREMLVIMNVMLPTQGGAGNDDGRDFLQPDEVKW
jgi:hypothetical protein